MNAIVLLSALWAAGALVWQCRLARGGGREDYSRPAGDPFRGLVYNFTHAMTPAHKETVRLHPCKFAVGMLMHAGALLAIVAVLLSAVHEASGRWLLTNLWPLYAAALACGLFLLGRRAASPMLRAFSVPDDYLAAAATCILLALALLISLAPDALHWLSAYAALLFIYIPLGKLRHALFFFVARGDYGRRLGYRGVYPPATPEPGAAE